MSRYEDLKDRARETIFDNVMGEIEAPKHQKMIHDILDRLEIDVDDLYDTSDSHTEDISQLKNDVEAKLDTEQYDSDKELQKEIDENQDKRIDDNGVKISENNQEIRVIKDTLKHLNSNDEIQEAKGSNVINLPENAMKSVAPNYRFEGLTLQNLVKNGDFSDGTKHWNVSGATFNDGIYTATGSINYLLQSFKNYGASEGDTLYVRGSLDGDGDNFGVGDNNVIRGKYKKGDVTSYIYEYTQSRDVIALYDKSSEYKPIRVGFIKIINLTQTFGAGNEPSKEWCDEHINGYFEGTKSVTAPLRIKSVGENLAKPKEKDFELGGIRCSYLGGNRCRLTGKTGARSASIIMTKPVSLGAGTYYSSCPLWEREKGDLGEGKIVLNKKATVSLYYWVRENSDYIDKEFELYLYRQGKAPSIIRPYQETIAYFNDEIELKSVGKVKDYIENGKLYKNTGEITNAEVVTISQKSEYVNVALVRLPVKYKNEPESTTINGFVETKSLPNEGSLPSQFYSATPYFGDRIVGLYIPKDIITVDDFYKKYGDIHIIYKIKTPEIINLNTSGLIEANPNGTVFLEPVTNVTAYYKDGLDVSSINIVKIEGFSHMVGGVYEPLDVSKIEIKDSKLTHPDAKNGLVYLVYRYDDNPIYGESTISYYNNNRVLESPNGTFFKPVFSVDDEGSITLKGEKL